MTARETELTQQLAQCQEALAAALRENQLLRQKVDLLVRRIFGSSSEKLDPAQLELLALPEAATAPVPPPAPPSQSPRPPRTRQPKAPRLPDNLPVVEQVIDPEPVKAQPEKWRQMGEEVTEQLDYEPGRFLKRRMVRRTFVHRTERDLAPVTAPLPPCLQERGLAAPGLMTHVLVTKYCDHVPLYRLEQIFAQRHGIHLPQPSGSNPSTNRFAPACWRAATCRWTRLRSVTWSRETAKPRKATCGWGVVREGTYSSGGISAGRRGAGSYRACGL